jgi:hypothetical protein
MKEVGLNDLQAYCECLDIKDEGKVIGTRFVPKQGVMIYTPSAKGSSGSNLISEIHSLPHGVVAEFFDGSSRSFLKGEPPVLQVFRGVMLKDMPSMEQLEAIAQTAMINFPPEEEKAEVNSGHYFELADRCNCINETMHQLIYTHPAADEEAKMLISKAQELVGHVYQRAFEQYDRALMEEAQAKIFVIPKIQGFWFDDKYWEKMTKAPATVSELFATLKEIDGDLFNSPEETDEIMGYWVISPELLTLVCSLTSGEGGNDGEWQFMWNGIAKMLDTGCFYFMSFDENGYAKISIENRTEKG